ncbi:MAG: DsbA family protein [Candidatus Woesearchaeota archaeon]
MKTKKLFALFLLIALMPLAAQADLYEEYKQYRTWGNQDALIDFEMNLAFGDSFSSNFHNEKFLELFNRYGQNGQVKFIHYDFPVAGHVGAHEAGWCVIHASPENSRRHNFWQFREYMFLYGENMTNSNLNQWVSELGNGNVDMSLFNTCFETKQFEDYVQRDIQRIQNLGFSTTPGFRLEYINIYEDIPLNEFKEHIDEFISHYNQHLERLSTGSSITVDGKQITLVNTASDQAIIEVNGERKIVKLLESARWEFEHSNKAVTVGLYKLFSNKNEAMIEIIVLPLHSEPIPILPPEPNPQPILILPINEQVRIGSFTFEYIKLNENGFDVDIIVNGQLHNIGPESFRNLEFRASNGDVLRLTPHSASAQKVEFFYQIESSTPIYGQKHEFTMIVGQRAIHQNMIFELQGVLENHALFQVRTQEEVMTFMVQQGQTERIGQNHEITAYRIEESRQQVRFILETKQFVEIDNNQKPPSETPIPININIPEEGQTSPNRPSQNEENQETVCASGCQINGNCIPIGIRAEGKYCDIDGEMKEQLEDNAICQNNYECQTNQCSSGTCQDLSRQIEEQTGLLMRILSWLGFR